jgi:DNA-binding transcriptional regulator YiaG
MTMKHTMKRVIRVEASNIPFTLNVMFDTGTAYFIDMTGVVYRLKAFAPLRNDAIFKQVSIINNGGGIAWQHELDYSAEALYKLAQAQQVMTGEDFKAWTERLHLSNNEASDILGLSPRTIKAYKTKKDNLPTAIAICCRVLEQQPQELHAHFKPRLTGRPPKIPHEEARM